MQGLRTGRYGIIIDSRYHDSLAKQQLGRSGVVLSATANSETTPVLEQLVRIQMPTEFAQGWVITMGTPMPFVGAPTTGIGETTAELKWGTAGVLNTAQIDWAQGSIVRLYGSTVIVNSIARLPNDALAQGRKLVLQASATPGEHGTNNTIFLTQDMTQLNQLRGSILSGGAATIRVPPFARRVSIAFNRMGDRTVVLSWIGQAGGSIQQFEFDATAFKSQDPSFADTGGDLPVPGHADSFRIQNDTPGIATMTDTKVIWTIGL